jgi:hypothetical protein
MKEYPYGTTEDEYNDSVQEEIAELRLMLAKERAENRKLVEIIIKIGKERAEQSIRDMANVQPMPTDLLQKFIEKDIVIELSCGKNQKKDK